MALVGIIAALAASSCELIDDVQGNEAGPTRKWFTEVHTVGDINLFNSKPALANGQVIMALPGALVGLDTAIGAQRWHADVITTTASSAASIAARDSIACLVDGPGVGCAVIGSGRVLWKQTGEAVAIGGTAAVDQTALFYSANHTLMARALADGHVIWSLTLPPAGPFPTNPTAITVRHDTLFVAGVRSLDALGHESRGELAAVAAADGHVLWNHEMDPVAGELRAQFAAAPAMAGDLAIVDDITGAWLVAIDVRSGQEAWRSPRDSSGYVLTYAVPNVAGDTVYVGSNDTQFYALDLHSGALLWRTRLRFSMSATMPCGRDVLIVPFAGGQLYAIDRATHVARKVAITTADDAVVSEIAVSGKTAFISSDKGMYAISCR